MPVDYHAWTHRPKALGGTDPIETATPWIVLVNSGQTLASSGAFTDSLMGEIYWDPALVGLNPADPEDDSDLVFRVDIVDNGAGSDLWQLTLNREGWYTFDMVHGIADLSAGDANDIFQQEIAQPTGVTFPTDANMGDTAIWNPEVNAQAYIQTYRTIWVPSSQQIYKPRVRQNTGASKDVEGALKVFYRGGFGGGTDNADWEVATV